MCALTICHTKTHIRTLYDAWSSLENVEVDSSAGAWRVSALHPPDINARSYQPSPKLSSTRLGDIFMHTENTHHFGVRGAHWRELQPAHEAHMHTTICIHSHNTQTDLLHTQTLTWAAVNRQLCYVVLLVTTPYYVWKGSPACAALRCLRFVRERQVSLLPTCAQRAHTSVHSSTYTQYSYTILSKKTPHACTHAHSHIFVHATTYTTFY